MPIFTPPPEPIPDAPPPQTVSAIRPGERIYISTQGDWWDTIALRVYGVRRGNERLMYRLLEANYQLRNVSHFPAGVQVIVPVIESVIEIPLVPWKKTSIIPA